MSAKLRTHARTVRNVSTKLEHIRAIVSQGLMDSTARTVGNINFLQD